MQVPKGDVLHQFRKDVESGTAADRVVARAAGDASPTIPASAWYGAWYLAEVLDILTKNPDVWKKTIFILTYDENDGYFDHVPPFVAPDPRNRRRQGGKGIDLDWNTSSWSKTATQGGGRGAARSAWAIACR